MKTSELLDFINGKMSSEQFKLTLAGDVKTYESLLKKKGSSIPLYFIEDRELVLDTVVVKTLLQETCYGAISNVDLAYICDCLTLGETISFENEIVEDIIFAIADPEINGGFKNEQDLKSYLQLLS